MTRPADVSPELKAAAVEAVRGGASLRDVASELTAQGTQVSHMTVGRWVRDAGAKPRRGRPPTLSAEQKAEAKRRRGQGASAAQVARELGVSEDATARAAAEPFAGTGPVDAPPAEVPLTPEQLARDPLDTAREQFNRIGARAEVELAAGNVETYNAMVRTQSGLLDGIRKLEAGRRPDGGDVVTFTPDELARGAALVRERIAAAEEHTRAAGGMVCAKCGEALRIEWASGGAPPPVVGGK